MKASKRTRLAARGLFRQCAANGAIDEQRAVAVGRELAASGRRGALAILVEFSRLVRLERERHRAVVESATPLAADVRDEIREGLMRLYGPGLDFVFQENPDLIGGLRIRVGSDVYDGSIQARLAALSTAW